MSEELSNFLNDEPVAEPAETEAVAEVAEPVAEETTAEPEAADNTEAEESSTAEQETQDKQIPIAALLDEREKRQASQQREKELTAKLAEYEATPKAEAPDVLDDQQGFVKSIQSDVQQAILNERANISEFHARQKHDDFDEKWPDVERFLQDKQLGQEVINHVDPYGHALKLFADHKEMESLKDPNHLDKLKAELKAELRLELEAETTQIDAKKAAKDALAETLTPSLASQRAEGANKPVLDVADPLETTFNR